MSNRSKSASELLGIGVKALDRKKRNLDDLANLDMTVGVEYPNPAVGDTDKTKEIQNNALLSNVTSKEGYGRTRLPNGTFVRSETRVIENLDDVSIFAGNPRAKTNPDISDLRPKIAMTGGNIIPVIARELPGGKIEVIAGSRRFRAVKEEGVALLADVILEPIDEEQALKLTALENQGRLNPDVFEEAQFYKTGYELFCLGGVGSAVNNPVDVFAQGWGMSYMNMKRYLNIASIPDWIYTLCTRYETDVTGELKGRWSLRKAVELYDIYKNNEKSITGEIRSKLERLKPDTPEQVIKQLRKALVMEPAQKVKTDINVDGAAVGSFVLGKRKPTLTLHLSEKAPQELREKIEEILKEYSN
ncbi:ParB/RepB/Spo0J family partition protein [Rheinheimera sp.]|uniref:ParB/RepB/Spo0J family partition protein n=1 Tax=Rheinheimera sp. TaxID=1869214 RepID=UPI00404752EB